MPICIWNSSYHTSSAEWFSDPKPVIFEIKLVFAYFRVKLPTSKYINYTIRHKMKKILGGLMMKQILISISLIFMVTNAAAGTVSGVYKTESNDDGAFLEVQFGPCETNQTLSCATILKAYRSENEINSDYEHLGKIIVADMEDDGAGKFSGGTIWDPSEDKTYNSKMTLKNDDLSVEGCILFFCKGQLWEKIK